MKISLAICALPLLVASAQTNCPTVVFRQGNFINAHDGDTYAGLQRQPNGSFSEHWYRLTTNFPKVRTDANAEKTLLQCSEAGSRTFRTPPGWTPMADQPMAPSRPSVFADLLGNGTPVGVGVALGGAPPLPAVDSIAVAIPDANGNVKSPSAFYPVVSQPQGVLVADLNHDGKRDVVVVGMGSATSPNGISVLLGKGDGTLQSEVRYAAHTHPMSVVAVDLNGDGHLDLVVANIDSADISVLMGRGDGTFSAPTNIGVATYPTAVAAGDFNSDGKMDIAVSSLQQITILTGTGTGTFNSPSVTSGQFIYSFLTPGDFNKDGKLDLAVASSDGTVSILLGDGIGRFSGQSSFAAGYGTPSLILTDVDGDGNLDVVTSSGHPDVLVRNPYDNTIRVLFGRGDGTLLAAPLYSLSQESGTVALADFDGDGKLDIAAASTDAWILLSQGDGLFKTPTRLSIQGVSGPIRVKSLAAGDVNGDGKPDLVVGDVFNSGVFVLLGTGTGTFQTPVRYVVSAFTEAVALGDLNGDGKLDIAVAGAPYVGGPTTSAVLLNNGNGTFQSARILDGVGGAPHDVLIADLNKDGKGDLVFINGGTQDSTTDPGAVVVLLGQGNGSFQTPVTYAVGVNPAHVAVGDLNGDGSPDLVVSTPGLMYNDPSIRVLIGNGNGTFRTAVSLPTDFGPQTVAIADIDGDSKQDIVIGHCCGNSHPSYMLGKGDGTLQPEVVLGVVSSLQGLAVGDLNNDKKPDLALGIWGFTSNPHFGFISTLLNVTSQITFPPAVNPLTNVNGASFLAGPLAPDSFATAQGTALATSSQQSGSPYPTTLAGTTVKVKDSQGVERLAGLAYVSPTQVNYIVPTGTALGTATITVTSGNGTVSQSTNTIASVGTGLFLFGGTNLLAANALRVKADFSQSVDDVYQISGSALVPKPIDLGPDTEQVYLVLYATGLRGASQANVTVSANGVNMPVLYSGLQPQYPGLDQIDALIPRSLIGKGDVTITVTVNGQPANTGHVTIK